MMTKKENVGKFKMVLSILEGLVPQEHRIRAYNLSCGLEIYLLVEYLYDITRKPSIDTII